MKLTASHPARVVLTLHELELFDPSIGGLCIGVGRGEQRALCPLCGTGKPRDAAHRSLCLNRATGVWRCHRCGEGGKVKEAWEERASSRIERAQRGLARAFDANVVTAETNNNQVVAWKRELRDLRSLDENAAEQRGENYLRGRGLSASYASAAGARFCPDLMSRPALVFPLRDNDGVLRGVHARYVDGRDRPKARTLGDKRQSLFATAGAFDAALPALIVTEAPLDALSLAQAGYPAVAVCGTQAPQWMHRATAFRRVLLAFDADDAGDKAAVELAPQLESYGARCERLRPETAKDWNEALQISGRDALSDWLAWRIL